jgi:flagellar protein FliS
MLNYSTPNTQNRLNPYLIKEISEGTPQQIFIKIYDFAIVNCKKKDLIKTNTAIQELINALRFDDEFREFSTGLYKLYLFCQEQMRKKNYGIVLTILTELRDSWINTINSLKQNV